MVHTTSLMELKMELNEALDLLKRVCAEYRGTLKEHQILQQALDVVEKKCSKDKQETEDS